MKKMRNFERMDVENFQLYTEEKSQTFLMHSKFSNPRGHIEKF